MPKWFSAPLTPSGLLETYHCPSSGKGFLRKEAAEADAISPIVTGKNVNVLQIESANMVLQFKLQSRRWATSPWPF